MHLHGKFHENLPKKKPDFVHLKQAIIFLLHTVHDSKRVFFPSIFMRNIITMIIWLIINNDYFDIIENVLKIVSFLYFVKATRGINTEYLTS